MSLGVSYMGTKRHLVGSLTDIVHTSRGGTFLDLFSGMCTVGSAVAPARQVWSNDLQAFSHLVALARFCSQDIPIPSPVAATLVNPFLDRVRAENHSLHDIPWAREAKAILECDALNLSQIFDESIERACLLSPEQPGMERNSLFVRRFGGTYFSFKQANDIDGIRCCIDDLLEDCSISEDQWRWMLLALCIAMAKCANTTGHFAQALFPKPDNVRKVVSQRKREIFLEWLSALGSLVPAGNSKWRQGNLAFRSEATDLLRIFSSRKQQPSIVYADPPYTQDQYSRYYHVYETLVLYDYPTCSGRGLYRPDRSISDFSLASKVEGAFEALVGAASELDCCFILSYPSAGLLKNSADLIPELIRQKFGAYPNVAKIAHQHSTMGASKGATRHDVTEIVYSVGA